MKTLTKILTIILAIGIFTSCESQNRPEPGTVWQTLSGNEDKLPPELKGLKVYQVMTDGIPVAVGILDGQVNSITYQSRVGSRRHRRTQTSSTIVLSNQGGEAIQVRDLVMENDSLVVFRK